MFLGCLSMAPPNTRARQAPSDPWTPQELMAPADLEKTLLSPESRPLILDVGPAGVILHALELGPAHEQAGYDALKKTLGSYSKDKAIVIYCGCCPFDKCPNIRPAFRLFQKMGFSHVQVLNLSRNLKADWIDKGYPLR